jgi:MoaA/NifB/PqqE/SkfB family radical SAM enzyme
LSDFKKIYIEITNRCNLACPFCAQNSRAKVFMAAAAFAEVLRRIHGTTRFISLHVLGEPLLHPEFGQMLAISDEQGMQVNLTTNGTLLGQHRPTLLAAPALRQINISLHGLAQMEQAAADMHLREIIDFAQEASRTAALYLSLRLWNLGSGEGQGGEGWNEYLLEQLTAAFAIPRLRIAALRAERGIPLAPRVFLNPEAQFSWPQLSAPDLGRQGYCRGLRDHLAILVDGTVVPCCLDAESIIAFGNIFNQSLHDILTGPRARRMREGFGHQWLVEPLCRRCTYRLRFSAPGQV